MPNYRFHFYFPAMPEESSRYTIFSWGGHVGTAMTRAWRAIKYIPVYSSKHASKFMKDMTVSISVIKESPHSMRSGPGFLT